MLVSIEMNIKLLFVSYVGTATIDLNNANYLKTHQQKINARSIGSKRMVELLHVKRSRENEENQVLSINRLIKFDEKQFKCFEYVSAVYDLHLLKHFRAYENIVLFKKHWQFYQFFLYEFFSTQNVWIPNLIKLNKTLDQHKLISLVKNIAGQRE